MLRARLLHRSQAGMSLPEVSVAAAVLALLMGSLMVGVMSLQRGFAASKEHAKSQLEQARFIDYVARDLRRALAVKVDTHLGSPRISMTIPDYYEPVGSPEPGGRQQTPRPRIPQIRKGYADYGAAPVVIRYFKSGSTLFRRVAGQDSPIATDVEDFQLSFPPDNNEQVVNVSVTFLPRYRLSSSQEAARAGTRASARVLLRNKRQGAVVPSTP